jgi:hypothetical protein
MVGLVRIELTTSPLSGVRSSQLSYRPSLRDIPKPKIEFEDKLNVRMGYAHADHHAETFGRDSSSEAPITSIRDRRSGVHDNSHAIPPLLLTRAGGEAQVRECHDVLS